MKRGGKLFRLRNERLVRLEVRFASGLMFRVEQVRAELDCSRAELIRRATVEFVDRHGAARRRP